jgi:hypothetical protein
MFPICLIAQAGISQLGLVAFSAENQEFSGENKVSSSGLMPPPTKQLASKSASKDFWLETDFTGRTQMLAKMTYGVALTALICFADLGAATSATAIPADLARKCSARANRAYPLSASHNPDSGRKHGSSQAVRDYFNRCVASGGKMDGHGSKSHHESHEQYMRQ